MFTITNSYIKNSLLEISSQGLKIIKDGVTLVDIKGKTGHITFDETNYDTDFSKLSSLIQKKNNVTRI